MDNVETSPSAWEPPPTSVDILNAVRALDSVLLKITLTFCQAREIDAALAVIREAVEQAVPEKSRVGQGYYYVRAAVLRLLTPEENNDR